MRVVHLGRTSATGHVVPRCGVWGSTDTDWTADGSGVTCVACGDAMQAGARDGLRDEERSARERRSVRRPMSGRSAFALRFAAIAVLAWVGAWALLSAGGVLLPAAAPRASRLALWITVAILVLGGAALAALAGKELALGTHGRRARARG